MLKMSAYGLLAYFTRITPALSVVSIVVLLVFSFVVHPHGRGVTGEGDSSSSATTWQIMLSIYTVALHIMSIVFPARVCYALGEVMRSMKELAATKEKPKGSGESLAVIKEEDETTLTPTPLFVIIIPAYKEDMNTLEETLHVLSSHAQARHEYHVRLRRSGDTLKIDGITLSLLLTVCRYTWPWRRRKRSQVPRLHF